MKAEGLSEIEFDSDNTKYHIKRQSGIPVQIVRQHIAQEEIEKEIEEEILDTISVKSPLSGTFYCSPKHGSPPYVNVGDVVQEGESLCIVEAMKVMNEIKADAKCKIIKVLAVNGKPVSSGEALFLVKAV